MRMKNRWPVVAVLALAVALGAAAPARAEEPTIWLHVEASGFSHGDGTVKITLPLSLIEVVLDSTDTSRWIINDIGHEKGIDLAKIWRQMRDMDVDEFVTVDSDQGHVKVFKDRRFLRITVQERGYEEPNIQVKIPLTLVDYLFSDDRQDFKLSQMLETMRDHLPLTIVEATHDEAQVKVWMDEK